MNLSRPACRPSSQSSQRSLSISTALCGTGAQDTGGTPAARKSFTTAWSQAPCFSIFADTASKKASAFGLAAAQRKPRLTCC